MYEIIVNKQENVKTIILLENKIVVEKYEESEENAKTEGNIYLGKVQNVLQGMQSAFIDIGERKNTFIHLKDLLPKVDTKSVGTHNADNYKLQNIKQIIKPGMPILVQVKKDSTNKKGARVSTHISLPGKYIVFMPNAEFITVSQKIEDEAEKERLTNIVKNLLPVGSGAIIRTSGKNKDEITLKNDLDKLLEEWKKIETTKDTASEFPILLHKNDGILKKLFIDMIEKKIDKVIVNDSESYEDILETLKEINNLSIKVELHNNSNLIDEYCLASQMEKIENRKVWLKCGGFITIDKTEALTAIDVNSGKYIGTKDLEQTVCTVNKEATKEIAKQLRLRDIGGIVVIDYIDMKLAENREKIEELLAEELKNDRSKTQVIGFTKLNLLEMTRKHIGINE